MKSEVLLERRSQGRVAVVTIDRPHRRNACDFGAWTDMRDTFVSLATDTAVRLVVLTGSGGHFCAGDDIVAFRSVLEDVERADTYRARIQECYAAIQNLAVPVVAAISGVCVGGGCSLALCCDFRIADQTARIGVPVAKLGLVYPTIQLVRLSHLIGVSEARRWLYTGQLFGHDSAYRCGFLDAIDSDGDVVGAALEFGAPMMEGAPLSIAGSKRQLNAISTDSIAENEAMIEEIINKSNDSEDYKNAAAAFAEKRKPVFLGR